MRPRKTSNPVSTCRTRQNRQTLYSKQVPCISRTSNWVKLTRQMLKPCWVVPPIPVTYPTLYQPERWYRDYRFSKLK